MSLDSIRRATRIEGITRRSRASLAATAFICALITAVALGDGPAAPPGAAASPVAKAAGKVKLNRTLARMEEGIRNCANAQRQRYGLKPLAAGPRLARAARFHAQSMSKGGFFGHTDPSGRDADDRVAMFAGRRAFATIGENIAAGQRGPRSVCRAWMHSPTHRANILRPGYTHVGGGFASGGPYRRYYVMELGRARG